MNNILKHRDQIGMKQAELARRVKCSRAHMCALEAGRVTASPTLAKKIAKELGIPAHAVIYPDEPFVIANHEKNPAPDLCST